MINKFLKYLMIFFLIITLLVISSNIIVVLTTKKNILSLNKITEVKNIDCLLVLGAGIRGNYPTPMLEERLQQSIVIYQQQISNKILVSGDHQNQNHDEVNAMKDYLVGHQIPSQDVFMDHAGISTYDSIYRAKYIFQAQKIIIITQEYHLHRALYIAKQLGIEAYGVTNTNEITYANQTKREVREILARFKDFLKCFFKPTSTYLGDSISITGNGDITND